METQAAVRRGLVIALGALTCLAGIGGSAIAQQKLALKASDVHPAGYPTVVAVESLGKKLEKATNGRLSVQMFASMQLARVSVGALGPVIDELNVFNLPFLFRNTVHMQKVIDGPIGQELLDKVTNNRNAGLIALAWMDAGARSLYDTKRPIRSIADLKGLKVRVMGNPMFVDMMNALGGNGVAMGYDQVFTALQTGVVDGAENNPPSFVFDNHYQVAKYYTLTEHLIVPEMLVFSKRIWNQLSKDDQALVQKLGHEAQMRERVLWNEYQDKALAKMKEAGIKVVTIKDKAPFQAAVKPVWDKYAPKFADTIARIQAVQ